MITHTHNLWAIHAGKKGEADSLFLSGCIALDSAILGDLSTLPAKRDAFRFLVLRCWPDYSARSAGSWAGTYFRFVHRMGQHDWVAYKSRPTGIVHLGRVLGPYEFHAEPGQDYAHRRTVRWLAYCPIAALQPEAKQAVESKNSLIDCSDHLQAFLSAMPDILL